ncbi:MAG: ABC transporter ATP-binding protein [Firmicutes bacterium]|nr:ABC transporter ATP-binding protein [Bacillota bacterium]
MSKERQVSTGFSRPLPGPGRPGGHGPGGGRFFAPVGKPENTKGTLLRLWAYLREQKGILFVVFILVAVSSVLSLATPFLMGRAVDRYILPQDFQGLLYISLLMLGLYFLASSTVFLQNYFMVGVSLETVRNLRKDLFAQLQVLPLAFFDNRPHGEIMSRLTNDVDNVSNVLNTSIISVFSSVIILAGSVVMMVYLSPVLTLASMIIIPLLFVFTRIITGYTREFFSRQQARLGDLNGFIEETISGQRVVKIFNREAACLQDFQRHNEELKKAGIRAQVFSGLIGPLMNLLNNLGLALIAAVGGVLVIKGSISVGVILSFINYTRFFTRPLNELANQINLIQSAIAGAERVFAVMDEEAESEEGLSPVQPEKFDGRIVFKNVSFGYKKDAPVLKDINLSASPGQVIALVGPTGAGKTTIINLLARFYDPEQGEILLDGWELRRLKREKLRSALGIVLQDTYLFADTVRENIRYGRLDASDEEVEEAARIANAEQFILRLPQGYETVLAENGEDLSQGQKQLLAIARAILADPRVLILDEATSNVDTRTEFQIQTAMLALMKGRTSFVIAHRLSTIRNADHILVVNNGKIIESGKHRELMERKGFYYDLYSSQFRGEAPLASGIP